MSAQLGFDLRPAAAARTAPPNGAIVDGPYRYLLWRTLAEQGGTVLWVMLNPSKADAVESDPTLTRCLGFSGALGYGRVELVNLFAWIATDPKDMEAAADPVGPRCDAFIREAADRADRIIVAWGAHPGTEPARRAAEVTSMLAHRPLWCLGRNANGSPKHPLYLAKNTLMQHFSGGVSAEPVIR